MYYIISMYVSKYLGMLFADLFCIDSYLGYHNKIILTFWLGGV